MPELRAGQKLIIFGTFESGKTTALREFALQFPRAFILDPSGELGDPPFVAVAHPSLEDLRTHPYVSVPGGRDDLEPFCELALMLEGYFVGIDELNLLIKGTSAAAIPPRLDELWRLGHKRKNTLALSGHRVSEVPGILRHAHHQLYFTSDEPLDVDVLEDRLGPLARQLPLLPAYHYLYKAPRQPARIVGRIPLASTKRSKASSRPRTKRR